MDGWNTTFLLGWPIFRCYVKLRGCRHPFLFSRFPIWVQKPSTLPLIRGFQACHHDQLGSWHRCRSNFCFFPPIGAGFIIKYTRYFKKHLLPVVPCTNLSGMYIIKTWSLRRFFTPKIINQSNLPSKKKKSQTGQVPEQRPHLLKKTPSSSVFRQWSFPGKSADHLVHLYGIK